MESITCLENSESCSNPVRGLCNRKKTSQENANEIFCILLQIEEKEKNVSTKARGWRQGLCSNSWFSGQHPPPHLRETLIQEQVGITTIAPRTDHALRKCLCKNPKAACVVPVCCHLDHLAACLKRPKLYRLV